MINKFTKEEKERLMLSFDWLDVLIKKSDREEILIDAFDRELINEILSIKDLLGRLADCFDEVKN
jgi:hypothetical protein